MKNTTYMMITFASEDATSSITMRPMTDEPRGEVHMTVVGPGVEASVSVPFDTAASEIAKVMMHFLTNGFQYVDAAPEDTTSGTQE